MTTRPSIPGKIHLFSGTVKGGKTKQLIALAETISYHGPVLYVNTTVDSRSHTPYSSHSVLLEPEVEHNLKTRIDMRKLATFDELFSVGDLSKYAAVIIDEAQFWKGLRDAVLNIAEQYGCDVYVGGLFADSNRNPFGEMHELVSIADSVTILGTTLCKFCSEVGVKTPALFSYRAEDRTGQQLQIGTDYHPVCRLHYLEKTRD